MTFFSGALQSNTVTSPPSPPLSLSDSAQSSCSYSDHFDLPFGHETEEIISFCWLLPTRVEIPFRFFLESTEKGVQVEIDFHSPIELSKEQLYNAQIFHVLLFSSVFKYDKDESLPMNTESIKKFDKSSPKFYLLLPLTRDGSGKIDWDLIDSTRDWKNEAMTVRDVLVASFLFSKINSMPLFLSVLSRSGIMPHSSFPKESEGTYYDYFKRKYNLVIQHLNEPLLQVSNVRHPKSLILKPYKSLEVNRKSQQESPKSSKSPLLLVKEFCDFLTIPRLLWKSSLYLPPILWRVENALLMLEFHTRINKLCDLNWCYEAMTSALLPFPLIL